jgi:AsmA protein
MKKILRYLLIAVGVLVLLLIAIPFFVSPNQFRPTIEEKLSAALGRQVKVGNLGLSLLSGALSADDLSIADDPAFSKGPFLTAKSLKVGVEMMPLILSRSLHVTGITIEKPEVTLLKNLEGRWNFSSLASGSSGSSAASGSSAKAPSGNSGGGSDFTVKKLELVDGRLTIGSTGSSKRSVYEQLNLQASNVAFDSNFPVTLTAKLPGGGGLKLDGRVGPVNNSDASLSPLDAKLAINGMDLGATGFVDASAGLGGQMDSGITLNSANGKAEAKGNIKLNKLQLARGGTPAGVPVNVDFDSAYDLRRSAGVLKQGTVKIGNAIARLAGTFESRGESTVVNLKLDGQNLPVSDLQAALPALGVMLPKGASLQQGTINVNLNAQGPTNKLVTTGNVGLYNAKLAGFDLGSKLSAISALSGTQTGADTSIEKLTTNLRAAPEGITASNLNLVMPALGNVTGNGTISAANALNFKMVAELSASSGMASTLGGLTGRSMSKNTKIPFTIQGTASDPKFVPDVGGMVGALAGSQLGNVLGDKTGGQADGLVDALGGLFGKKKKKQ